MSLEEIEKIFHPFYRGAHGRRFPQGMGLGLSIAREFTKAHGGELTVESNPGSGSCFTVWLPAQPAVLKVAINSQKRSDKA
jgi:signal transduction histidine kinase